MQFTDRIVPCPSVHLNKEDDILTRVDCDCVRLPMPPHPQQQCVSSGSLRVTLVTRLWAWSGLYRGAPGGLSAVITIVLVVTL